MSDKAKELVERMKEIPTLPSVVTEVNRLLQDDGASQKGMISIIETDTALTSKVLRLANSSYYGMSRQVKTIQQAVLILGLNTLRSIALAASVGKIFSAELEGVLNMKDLWHHSVTCGIASKALTRHMGPVVAEEGFVCGLLHDIGKVIMAMNLPEETKAVALTCREQDGRSWWEVEREMLGFTHPEVGALVAIRWDFPQAYCDAIEYHHWPHESETREGESTAPSTHRLAYGIFAADCVANTLTTDTEESDSPIDPGTLEILGIDPKAVPGLLEKIREDRESVMSTWGLE
jgi:putative nucleotidyltransferase with HDIG domain